MTHLLRRRRVMKPHQLGMCGVDHQAAVTPDQRLGGAAQLGAAVNST